VFIAGKFKFLNNIKGKGDGQMKNKIIIVMFTLVILLSFTMVSSAEWTIFNSKDEMTGDESWYARSPYVEPTEKMSFPYHNISASLTVGYDGESEWAYIVFNEAPNILDTELGDGYEIIETRIKWDDEVEKVKFTKEWSSKFIHFLYSDENIKKIKSHNTVLLELKWYNEGEVYFKFSLDGSSDAINKIHEKFN